MSKITLEEVNNRYVDVLKEIGNVGAGNAMTAIASMLGIRIDMNVPKVELLEVSKLGSAICPEEEIIVGIFLEVQTDINGSMMFLMKMDSARFLVNKLMGRNTEDEKEVNAGENKTAGGLFFYLCRLRKSIHGLRQFQTEILLPRMLCQEPFQRR